MAIMWNIQRILRWHKISKRKIAYNNTFEHPSCGYTHTRRWFFCASEYHKLRCPNCKIVGLHFRLTDCDGADHAITPSQTPRPPWAGIADGCRT